MKYDTIKEACEAWIHEMSAIPQNLVKKAYLRNDFDEITEVTPPSVSRKRKVDCEIVRD